MRSTGAMRVLRLPGVAELRDRPLLARGDEDRVVAETLASGRLGGDASLEDACPAELLPAGSEKNELRDVPRRSILDTGELGEELLDRGCSLRRIAGGEDPRPAAQRSDFESGILRQHPRLARGD